MKWVLISFIIVLILKLKDFKNFLYSENVLSCFDCYWYARITEELLNGKYTPIDYLRNYPDFVVNPIPPPLLSVLAAGLTKLGIPLNHIYTFLPPILSISFCIPLFFLLRKLPIEVFIGSFVLGSLNLIYFSRTSLGRFDTDILILMFIFLTVVLLYKSVESIRESNYKSVFYITTAGLITQLFMWYYPKFIFPILFAYTLVSYGFIRKVAPKTLMILVVSYLIISGFTSWYYGTTQLYGYVLSRVLQKQPEILPPNSIPPIVELTPINVYQLVDLTTQNLSTILFSLVGFLILFRNRYQMFIPLIPFILMGLMAFRAGNRMIIYLAPFIGMGLGYFFFILREFISRKYEFKIVRLFSVLFTLFFSIPPYVLFFESKPIISDRLYEELKKIKPILDKDSIILSWWDLGYVFQYIFGIPTYVDNGNQNVIKMYMVANSLISTDEKKSYRTIAYMTNEIQTSYVNKLNNYNDTYKWIKNIHSEYKKKPGKQVYIIITADLIYKTSIHNLGTFGLDYYDDVPSVSFFMECEGLKSKSFYIYNCGPINLTLSKADFKVEWSKLQLKSNPPYKKVILIDKRYTENKVTELYMNKSFPHNRILEIIVTSKKAYILLINEVFYNSLLHKMFVLGDELTYFEPVYLDFPIISVYKLKIN